MFIAIVQMVKFRMRHCFQSDDVDQFHRHLVSLKAKIGYKS